MNEKNIMTIKEFGEKYKITRQALMEFRRKGMPYIPVGLRSIRLDEEEVLAWLKEYREKNKNKGV